MTTVHLTTWPCATWPPDLEPVVFAGVATTPANLESTTLALAHGLDLFFTRIQPSKTFDLLPDDFPYAMLVLVFVTLSGGSLILKQIDERRAIQRKWT